MLIIDGIYNFDDAIDTLLNQADAEDKVIPAARKPIPMEHRQNLDYLLGQLNSSDPKEMKNADMLIKWMISDYGKRGYDTAVLERKYTVARLHPMRTQKV